MIPTGEIPGRLDELAAVLAAGPRADLEQRARALLDPARPALEKLLEAARAGQLPPAALDQCRHIRRQLSTLRELLTHGEQVCAGLRGIVGSAYQAHAGAQYSALGEPVVAVPPRLLGQA